ncbi:MAG: hypothetical protein ABMB14_11115, partial [Myxococcota bacterium]
MANAHAIRAKALVNLGDLATAEAALCLALATYRRMGEPQLLVTTLVLLAEVALERGDPPAAAAWVNEAGRHEPDTVRAELLAQLEVTRAWVRAESGDPDGASVALGAALEAADRSPRTAVAPILATVGRVEALLGRTELATDRLAAAEAALRASGLGPGSALGLAVRDLRRALIRA